MLPDSLRRASCAAIYSLAILFCDYGAAANPPACVGTTAALQAALTAAASDNQDSYIELEAGGNFALTGPLTANITDGHLLSIVGGYSSGCPSPPFEIPDQTVINGNNVAGSSVAVNVHGGDLILRNLSLEGLRPTGGSNAIALIDSDAGGTIHVENVAVSNNLAGGGSDSIVAITVSGGLLFDDNVVHDNGSDMAAVDVTANYPALPIVVANNTITANTAPGLYFNVFSVTPAAMYNNILWNNGTSDLTITNANSAVPPLALNNTLRSGKCLGCAALAAASINNSNADPQLLAGTFRLGSSSPAINAGMPLPMSLPAKDAGANTRSQGSAPDRGAYETSINDIGAGHVFVVSSNADDASNPATLRGAITAANAANVPARINFAFASGCPQYLLPTSPLPAITVPMLIDGFSQSGTLANTLPTGAGGVIASNAALCITVIGGNSAPSAFTVPSFAGSSVHLDVRGLTLENFAHAIVLSGGSGHWIHGNVFAVASGALGTVGNGIAVQVDGGIGSVVGGPALADVNLIGASSGAAGVLISGTATSYNTIANNSIGGAASGTGAGFGNKNAGIELQGSDETLVSGNWIVANGSDGVLIDGASHALVQANTIGSNLAAGLGNVAAGVHATDNASNNWIGTTEPTVIRVGANLIEANAAQGVWIDASAGRSNLVSGNSIVGNAGLAIDLAAAGPTPDQPNGNSGPNILINKPHLSNAKYDIVGSTFTLKGVLASTPASYRYVSVYAGRHCGDADVFLGSQFSSQAAADGTIALLLSIPSPNLTAPIYISATAEDGAAINDTSEISICRLLLPSDDIFNDGLESF